MINPNELREQAYSACDESCTGDDNCTSCAARAALLSKIELAILSLQHEAHELVTWERYKASDLGSEAFWYDMGPTFLEDD